MQLGLREAFWSYFSLRFPVVKREEHNVINPAADGTLHVMSRP